MLPNFLCIGAQKCGTTTIWRMLDAHPAIFMARPRETRFFFDDFQFFGGIQSYEITYFSAWHHQPVVGEKCPEYLYVPNVAQRIRERLGPDIKFIVALRNPAQRAFSHYRHNLAMLRESRSFAEVLETEAAILAASGWPHIPFGYLGRGLYARQLQPYLELFPKENFLFVSFEGEVLGNQQQLANRIYTFLGVEQQHLRGLPFRDGKPALANLTVKLREGITPSQGATVEIVRRTVARQGTRSILKWLRGKKGRITASIAANQIRNPSAALIAFSDAFARNSPTFTSLPSNEALSINQYHFADDIAQLSAIVPFSVGSWLESTPLSGP